MMIRPLWHQIRGIKGIPYRRTLSQIHFLAQNIIISSVLAIHAVSLKVMLTS